MRVPITIREARKREAGQRRDILALIRKFADERSEHEKLAGNYRGAEAIKTLGRDLMKQVKARYSIEDAL